MIISYRFQVSVKIIENVQPEENKVKVRVRLFTMLIRSDELDALKRNKFSKLKLRTKCDHLKNMANKLFQKVFGHRIEGVD